MSSENEGSIINKYGRLAQLVERHFDVVDVRGSIPLSPTKYKSTLRRVLLLYLVMTIEESKSEANVESSRRQARVVST